MLLCGVSAYYYGRNSQFRAIAIEAAILDASRMHLRCGHRANDTNERETGSSIAQSHLSKGSWRNTSSRDYEQRVPKKAYAKKANSGMLEETRERVSSFRKFERCTTSDYNLQINRSLPRLCRGRRLNFPENSPSEFLHFIVPRNFFWDVPCTPSMLQNG